MIVCETSSCFGEVSNCQTTGTASVSPSLQRVRTSMLARFRRGRSWRSSRTTSATSEGGRGVSATRAKPTSMPSRDFPEFAEAQASLGAIHQLLGDLDAADARYAAARRVNPALIGLDRNTALLERERDRAQRR